jgi:hypothetical protein
MRGIKVDTAGAWKAWKMPLIEIKTIKVHIEITFNQNSVIIIRAIKA